MIIALQLESFTYSSLSSGVVSVEKKKKKEKKNEKGSTIEEVERKTKGNLYQFHT